MVQAANKINLVVKNHIGYRDDAAAALIGDGATADDTTIEQALAIAAEGGVVAATDVKVRGSDFNAIAAQLKRSNDLTFDPQ